MAMTMDIEIVARETIKPSSPTPQHLRNFNFSLIDQTAPVMFTPLLLFYPENNNTNNHLIPATQRSQKLKTSLSKLLTVFYPLAGIIKEQTTIECNDDGAEYVEAQIKCNLSDILQQPDASMLRSFLPVEIESEEADSSRLLFVQANFFKCGGMVIGVCISHKIADTQTLSTVLNSWSQIAISGSSDGVKFPEFNAASIFPPLDSKPHITIPRHDSLISKRCVIESSKIVSLKAKAAGATVQQPTRVEAVTALIWKCMINVSRSAKGFPRLSVISHVVNLRKRIEPPLPENCIGNIVGAFFAAHSTEKETDLQGLVCELRKELTEFKKTGLQKIKVEKRTWLKMCGIENLLGREDIDYHTCTSWCRFPLYEVDFGWGKPIWTTVPSLIFKNAVFMMDARDGEGVEVMVSLSEEDMALFEGDQDLLEFATVNPGVMN
ncbi:BAHD acyltransferase At5g47980-like [Pistacia vera]|uniref:BAHD acyltransferase At5g47980-like n=1 Tax=Pistacia vera TaxID=55513 RepID=UPI0012638655|nr:BAHD acyltransferase At5g47980-like [Pistacia vera]